MLLIDGVKYELWQPKNEEDFEQIAKEHVQDIFGENSIYLDTRQKLKSKAGIGSIPDGYAIALGNTPCWHIVEMELSSHPIYDHIVTQVSKFINGIKNHNTQKEIVNLIYDIIDGDDHLKLKVRKAIEPAETYKFLTELISQPPELTVIIEQKTEALNEALSCLAISQSNVLEFQTFTRQGTGLTVHAHLFEPLYQAITPKMTIIPQVANGRKYYTSTKKQIELLVSNHTCIEYNLFTIPKHDRPLFPGYNVPFKLETDIGEIETHVSAATKGHPAVGDPNEGTRIQFHLRGWYRQHPAIKIGDKFIIEVIEPMKKYRLKKA